MYMRVRKPRIDAPAFKKQSVRYKLILYVLGLQGLFEGAVWL